MMFRGSRGNIAEAMKLLRVFRAPAFAPIPVFRQEDMGAWGFRVLCGDVMMSKPGKQFTGEDNEGYYVVGKLGRQVRRGCYRLAIFGSNPGGLKGTQTFYLRLGKRTIRLGVKELKIHARSSTCSFGEEDITAVGEELSGKEVYIVDSERAGADGGEHYVNDLIGCSVYTDEGQQLGALSEILRTGANDVYVVRNEKGEELLLPAIGDVVVKVDVAKKKVIVRLMEEMG